MWSALLIVLALAISACGENIDSAAPAEEAALDGTPAAPDEPADDEPAAADEPEPPEDEAVAAGEGLTGVSSAFPLAWLAREIAPGADVEFFGAGGADPHDLELSPGDRALFETADVVLYMGDLDFQPQVEAAVHDAAGEVVDVRAIAGDEVLLPLDGDAEDGPSHGDEGADDDGHSHGDDATEDDHADDDHDHGAYDPHLWFDTAVMADVVIEIGEAFIALDGEHEAVYRTNAAALRDELEALGGELDELLSGCRFDTAIVSHEAYAYLLAPRDLGQEGISGAGGHGEASPQRLAELSARIQEEDVPAVLAEPLHGREDAEALSREARVDLLEIDPLEIGTDEHFERGYLDLLREQGERFATAMDCHGAG